MKGIKIGIKLIAVTAGMILLQNNCLAGDHGFTIDSSYVSNVQTSDAPVDSDTPTLEVVARKQPHTSDRGEHIGLGNDLLIEIRSMNTKNPISGSGLPIARGTIRNTHMISDAHEIIIIPPYFHVPEFTAHFKRAVIGRGGKAVLRDETVAIPFYADRAHYESRGEDDPGTVIIGR